ncbi:MAG: sigma factor-like helix-turn-helix DNA-binding protein [Candidatus Hinthialibacter antarcticus]|nr:sigma factor-like helix-turn-helix DNA-binding protein [Candidatus Hinthialibacter antarcticus]
MDKIEEKKKMALLMDVYGGLLTDRQREFLDLHYNEDLSYGEIADAQSISRQAVHDSIQHGKKGLFRFEDELGLAAQSVGEAPSANGSVDIDAIREQVSKVSKLVNDDLMYDIEPMKRAVRQLQKLVG